MAAQGFRDRLMRIFGMAAKAGAEAAARELERRNDKSTPSSRSRTSSSTPRRSTTSRAQPTARPAGGAAGGHAYAGDFTGTVHPEYTPRDDGRPDPGEVVWAWVPYEEDHTQGKDRPVLIVARHGQELLGLMLTSKDHDRDAEQEARYGRYWLDVGTGAWDSRRRPSEVRLDRVLRLDPDAVRREGATLDPDTYKAVAAGVKKRSA